MEGSNPLKPEQVSEEVTLQDGKSTFTMYSTTGWSK